MKRRRCTEPEYLILDTMARAYRFRQKVIILRTKTVGIVQRISLSQQGDIYYILTEAGNTAVCGRDEIDDYNLYIDKRRQQ